MGFLLPYSCLPPRLPLSALFRPLPSHSPRCLLNIHRIHSIISDSDVSKSQFLGILYTKFVVFQIIEIDSVCEYIKRIDSLMTAQNLL